MNYRSTRDSNAQLYTDAQAIIQGLAPDGGLFVPAAFPQPQFDLTRLTTSSYQQLAQTVLQWFFPHLPTAATVPAAYGAQWDHPRIAPLTPIHAGSYYLELFHGPTLAFKDVALQVLPHLLQAAKHQTKDTKETIILTATSGDTGTAALRGFRNVAGTRVIVFYPQHGISPIQEAQMRSQQGDNLHVVAVKGNFDQAQTTVKEIFNDPTLAAVLASHQQHFSSANSMNIGRLIPQITYYFSAYGQLLRQGVIQAGDQVNFAVPTGNFGDILAGYYATKLGLPVGRLICASNKNNVLTDFFATGTYDKRREFFVTNSPSMDILVSSNLERLLFDVSGGDAELVQQLMHELQDQGHYSLPTELLTKLKQLFAAEYATPDEIQTEINRVFKEANYLIDPHTAVGSIAAHRYRTLSGDPRPCVVVATASPYKFPETVLQSLDNTVPSQSTGLDAIEQLAQLDPRPLTAGVEELFTNQPQPVLTTTPATMPRMVLDILKKTDK